ncbi:MAG: flagellar M-ring protein FliF [Bdellovibrionales bacterium]|nr:flagellar M-ring protein FliF [Bdellovibrionales bacterium]
MDFFSRITAQIKDFVKGLSTSRKMALAMTGGAIFLFLCALFYWSAKQAYQPITYGTLNAEDSANVMRLLREKKVPFQVDPTGKSITVPPEYLHDLRLELAMQGMPQSSGVGYELFDKQAFGTTSFLNQVNKKRALEGELMRSINTIKGVKRSRVHLAIPEKSAFVEDQKKPTASVVLDLDSGTNLNEKQVYGVTHLVASAVEGLDPGKVTILDSFGKELSKNSRDSLVALTSEQSEFKRKYEEEEQRRVEELLSKVVGEGHVKVAVTADLDFSNTSEQQTILDQDGATLKSRQKITENMENNRKNASGPPGASSNTPGEQPGLVQNTPGGTTSKTDKDNEIVNYEIPKIVRTTQKSTGNVKKLSVAVLIDGKTVRTVDKDGKVESKNEAWSKDKLAEFEAIVTGSLALDKKRGDTLEIKNMEFVKEDFEEAQKILDATAMRDYIRNLVTFGVIGLVIVLFFFFIVRPYIRWITENTTESVDTFLPQTIEELEKIQKSSTMSQLDEVVPDLPERLDPEKIEGEMIREKIVTLIDNNPHKASLVLKEWLIEEKKDDKNAEGGGKAANA